MYLNGKRTLSLRCIRHEVGRTTRPSEINFAQLHTFRKVAKQIGKAVLPTVALSAITYTMAKQTSASGRSFVNSYVSANGSKTMSSLKNELNNFDWSRLNSFRNVARSAGKSVDRSGWNWADYAWEEMNRHPY